MMSTVTLCRDGDVLSFQTENTVLHPRQTVDDGFDLSDCCGSTSTATDGRAANQDGGGAWRQDEVKSRFNSYFFISPSGTVVFSGMIRSMILQGSDLPN